MAAVWTGSVARYNDGSGENRVTVHLIWDETDELGQRFEFMDKVAWPPTSPEIAAYRIDLLARAQRARNRQIARRARDAQITNTVLTYMNARGTPPA